jgi:hypothetical protein
MIRTASTGGTEKEGEKQDKRAGAEENKGYIKAKQ